MWKAAIERTKLDQPARSANASQEKPMFPAGCLVERTGIEPVTSGLQIRLGTRVGVSGR
jgi:hypothetical protein